MSGFASRRSRRALAACLVAVAAESLAQDVGKVEVSVQAAYLYQFTRFVEWPQTESTAPIVVCVVGRDPFGEALEQSIEGKRAGKRSVVVRRLAGAQGVSQCSIAFTHDGESSPGALRERAAGAPVLLVGDSPDFARRGGMIGFYREADRVRFEVNAEAAEAVGLRISSRLLGVSRVVSSAGAGR
jgi:hypothetical protein